MKANDPKKRNEEYSEFLSGDTREVPRELSERVIARVYELLYPSAWLVFGKILAIHLAVGFLSLSVCHQFGMNPFGTERSLDDWFMTKLGHSACMIACGVLFVSLTVVSASFLLTIEELKVMRRTEFVQIFALGLVSLTGFRLLGAELALTFAGLWLLGALIGGAAATEIGCLIRSSRFARS